MNTKIERIQKDIEKLAEYTATPYNGITRLPFTPEDGKAREYIKEQMIKVGLKVWEDGVGTIIGRMEGTCSDAPAIMIGSHYDSVKNGGAFDGVAGVVAAIEVARVLNMEGIKLKYPIEIAAMNDEEGVRFGTGMLSSRAMIGELTEEELDTAIDEKNTTMRQAMKNFGINPQLDKAIRRKGEIKAFIELHIEQGPILESNVKEIGIVENIVGLVTYKVIIKGRPGHAGTTPMHLRSDALVAASETIIAINSTAIDIGDEVVATVGEISVSPNASNVIPGIVEFTVDIRSSDEINIEKVYDVLDIKLKELEIKLGVQTKLTRTFYSKPVSLSKSVIGVLNAETIKLGYSNMRMNSGAGHDSMVMANYVETGMVFVPSKNGISHTPEEWTDYSELQKGTEVLLNTVINLCNKNLF